MYNPKDKRNQVFQMIAPGVIKINKYVPSRNKGRKGKQISKVWIEGKGLVNAL